MRLSYTELGQLHNGRSFTNLLLLKQSAQLHDGRGMRAKSLAERELSR